MKTEHISYLLTVARTGSINKASLKLDYPVQKLSTIMTNVENEFNTKFFIRSRHGVSLTPEGEIFIKYLDMMYSILSDAKIELLTFSEEMKKDIIGEINLYSMPLINDVYYVDAYKEFASEYPNICLNILTDSFENILERLKRNGNAMGLIINIRGSDSKIEEKLAQYNELVLCPLFRRSLVVVCKKDNALINTNQNTISLKSLKEVPFIACSTDKKSAASSMINYVKCSQIKYHTANRELFFELLNRENCFSVIGVDDINDEEFKEKYPQLTLIPLRDDVFSEDIVVFNKKNVLSEAERCFLNFLFIYRDIWCQKGTNYLDCSGCELPEL